MDETQMLRDLIMRLAERIYKQSELLSKRSERKPCNFCGGTRERKSGAENMNTHFRYGMTYWEWIKQNMLTDNVDNYQKYVDINFQAFKQNSQQKESIPGVGPDAPTITNDAGGKQSASPYRCDLVPPAAYLRIAAILAEGARKYGDENWRNISFRDHINHALSHVAAYLAGDRSDDHIGHAMCRIMFAFETMEPDEDFPPSMLEQFRPVILPSGSQSANPCISELVGVQP